MFLFKKNKTLKIININIWSKYFKLRAQSTSYNQKRNNTD